MLLTYGVLTHSHVVSAWKCDEREFFRPMSGGGGYIERHSEVLQKSQLLLPQDAARSTAETPGSDTAREASSGSARARRGISLV